MRTGIKMFVSYHYSTVVVAAATTTQLLIKIPKNNEATIIEGDEIYR